MFDPTFSVINWMLFRLGVIHSRINWLGDPHLALISVIIVNVWRGVPFYAIALLAGLQTISPELHEAAAIDGARAWQRFRHVTWPLLLPVTLVIVLFSVIQTFADFQLVYVLTGGGPANATQLFATYAYQLGIGTGLLSQGATISLAVFPVSAGRGHRPAPLHPPGRDPLRAAKMRPQVLARFSSFPRAREFRSQALGWLPPVQARGRLWTPAFAGVTGTALAMCAPFSAGPERWSRARSGGAGSSFTSR